MTEPVVVIEPMGFGGICHYTYNLCEALASRGVRASLITARNYEMAARPRRFRLWSILNEWFVPELPDRPAQPRRQPGVLDIARRRLKSAVLMLRIVATVVKTGASVVHLQWPVGPHDWMYLAVLRGLGRRIVFTIHDVLPHEHKPADVRRLRRLLMHVDRAILHSEENERTFHRIFTDAAPPSSLVPHGDYLAFAARPDPTPAQARAALGIAPDTSVVLFFGAIRSYKGLADLIRAFPRIRASVPGACLLIAGRPFGDFAPYERAIAEAGIGDCTGLHLAYHAIDDVAKFFRAADVVALPYRSASQSGVAQLAFAFAKPIVATRVGGLPEVIEEGRTGLLVEPRDQEAMAGAIARLLTDPSLRQSMGTLASEVATSRYSWDRIAEMTLNVYDLAREPQRVRLPVPQ
jgi:D-inositol-3-phosphate glycosyltransferase